MSLKDSLRESLHIARWSRDQQIQRVKDLRAAEIHQQCLKTTAARELLLLCQLNAQVLEIESMLRELEPEHDLSDVTPESMQGLEQLSFSERNLLRHAAEVAATLPRDSPKQVST